MLHGDVWAPDYPFVWPGLKDNDDDDDDEKNDDADEKNDAAPDVLDVGVAEGPGGAPPPVELPVVLGLVAVHEADLPPVGEPGLLAHRAHHRAPARVTHHPSPQVLPHAPHLPSPPLTSPHLPSPSLTPHATFGSSRT